MIAWALLGLGVALVGGGWLLAAAVVGGGDRAGTRLGTASRAVPWGLGVALAVFGLIRLWCAARGIGPADVVQSPIGTPPGAAAVLDALGRLVAVGGLAAFTGIVGRGAIKPGRADRGALGGASGWDSFGAALAGALGIALLVLLGANPVAWGVSVPLDLLAFGPLLAVGLVLWLPARRAVPRRVKGVDPQPLPGAETRAALPDPAELLRRAGLVHSEPDVRFEPRRRSVTPNGSAARLWAAVGGEGAPPEALAETLRRVDEQGAVVIPDAPGHTERRFLAAVLLGVLVEQGGRALVISREPVLLRALFERGLTALGSWLPGPLVATPPELKAASDNKRLPAALLFTPDVANAEGIPYLAHEDGAEFARQLSVVIVSRPDLLGAVPSSHLYFTMARLRLHAREGARPAAVVTAHGSSGILDSVNKMLGLSASRVPLRLPESGRVRIFRGHVPGGEMSRDAVVRAVKEAWATLKNAGIPTTIEDSAELLSNADLGRDRTEVALDLPGALAGDCTLMVVSDEEIAPVYRMARNSPPREQRWGQVVVWWVMPSPLSNFFLAERGRLQAQDKHDLLPAPTPLFARENSHLQKLHLQAALHEGTPEEVLLRQAFGSENVSALLDQSQAKRVGRHASLEARSGIVRRSYVLAPAPGQQRPDTSRKTITSAEVQIVDGNVGSVLDQADLITVQTHYYPHRVFGSEGRRYKVRSGGGFDRAAKVIEVDPVGNEMPPTRPDIAFDVKMTGRTGEWDQRRAGPLDIQAGDVRARVTETVTRALSLAAENWSRFDTPVTASYLTEVKVVWLLHVGTLEDSWADGLAHVARLLDDVLITHLRCRDENIEVVPRIAGFGGVPSPALLFIDRHVGGAGVADALSLDSILSMLHWTQAVMKACPCDRGCPLCTPPEVLRLQAKNEAISLLGG